MLDPLLDPWLDLTFMFVHAFPLYILLIYLYYYYRQTWPCTTYHYIMEPFILPPNMALDE